jgi:hypothetical protein
MAAASGPEHQQLQRRVMCERAPLSNLPLATGKERGPGKMESRKRSILIPIHQLTVQNL